MSLHAQITEEAARKLRIQERKSQILSIIIACLSIALIAGILALFALPMMIQETPTIVTYSAELDDTQDLEQKKVVPQTQRRPTAPSQNMAKVIAASTTAPTAIPVPDIEVSEPSLNFGDDMDFGQGWGDEGFGGGSGGGFGSSDPKSGGLPGFLYDLKQDGEGNARPYNTGFANAGDFVNPMLAIQRSGFSHTELRNHFMSPKPLYITRFAIPRTPADQGPKLFEAADHVEPKGWFALYRGKVTVPRDGEYRFSGASDDYMAVYLDGEARLHAHYPHIQNALSRDWKTPPQPAERHNAPEDTRRCRIIYGDWVKLRAGQQVEMIVGVGENPGGVLWFILQVEEKGVEYRKAADGRPILPLFTTTRLWPDDITQIKEDFPRYEIEFDVDKTPVFQVSK